MVYRIVFCAPCGRASLAGDTAAQVCTTCGLVAVLVPNGWSYGREELTFFDAIERSVYDFRLNSAEATSMAHTLTLSRMSDYSAVVEVPGAFIAKGTLTASRMLLSVVSARIGPALHTGTN